MTIKNGMILAAGLGKRMHPLTLKTPKPLIQIGNKNLLERAIMLLIAHGIKTLSMMQKISMYIGSHYYMHTMIYFLVAEKPILQYSNHNW